jgi:fatty-acid peroxygenase
MADIPHDRKFDDTFALLSEGYNFIPKRCQELDTDAFQSRLLLKKVTFALGEDAARMFYHPDRFTRKKAMPPTALTLLQDVGSVQLRDGDAHRRRKHMFMSLMTPEHHQQIVDLAIGHWQTYVSRWENAGSVVLHDQMREIFCRAACDWLDIPLSESQVKQRTREFGAMIDGAGALGPKNIHSQILRRRTEAWAKDIIQKVRSHYRNTSQEGPLGTIAWHREQDGMLLDADTAAVELLNLIRPTVAIARYVVFGALALHEHPEAAQRLREGDDAYSEWFVQEVRRFYPFFPAVGGRVREPFQWHGHQFGEGEWVLLDLYGTNHDARIWEAPDEFRPERFATWDGSPFNFVPQGAGAFHNGHRCPGERLTIDLTKAMLKQLVSTVDYRVPEQDLSIDMAKMPAIPASRFVISEVRRRSVH